MEHKIITNLKFMLYGNYDTINSIPIFNFLGNKNVDVDEIASIVMKEIDKQKTMMLVMKNQDLYIINLNDSTYGVIMSNIKDNNTIAVFNVKPYELESSIGKLVSFQDLKD